jgi:hypothetical protein
MGELEQSFWEAEIPLSVEEMQEKAAHRDVQFWTTKKLVRMEFLGGVHPEAWARYQTLLEIETRVKLDPIFRSLEVPDGQADLVQGLAEDIARAAMEPYAEA